MTCLQDVLQLCLQDVFKTSWKTKKCYTEDVFKTSSRRLQYVFIKTNVCWDSFSRCQVLEQKHWELSLEIKGNKCNSVFHTAVKALIKLAIAAIKEVISTTIFFLSISSNCKIQPQSGLSNYILVQKYDQSPIVLQTMVQYHFSLMTDLYQL